MIGGALALAVAPSSCKGASYPTQAQACFPGPAAGAKDAAATAKVIWRELPAGWASARDSGLPKQLVTNAKPRTERAQAFDGPLSMGYLRKQRRTLAQLGGDYWRGPYDIGADGSEYIDTAGLERRDGKGNGVLLSPRMAAARGYVAFSVGGGGGPHTEVSVCVETPVGCEPVRAPGCTTHGPGVLGMERFVCDLAAAHVEGKDLRLLVRDESSKEPGSPSGLGFLFVGPVAPVAVAPKSGEAPPKPAAPPLWGLADLHAHVFNHLGSGGRVIHGKVFSPTCDKPHDPACMRDALGADCVVDHNAGGRTFTTEPLSHDTGGFPEFTGWPRWYSVAHQQAYVDWIERAYRGGLRLIQVDAGNNRVFAEAYEQLNVGSVPELAVRGRGDHVLTHSYDEDVVRIQQLRALEELVGPTGPAREWAAIARSSAEARRIARLGKLVLVPGFEEDEPGDDDQVRLAAVQDATDAVARPIVRQYVEKLWNEGFRHFFPVHVMPTVFGETAVYNRRLHCGAVPEIAGVAPLAEGFDAGVRYQVDHDVLGAEGLIEFLESNSITSSPLPGVPRRYASEGPTSLASCFHLGFGNRPAGSNSAALDLRSTMARDGLSSLGRLVIEEMMRAGMLVDLTHMGERTRSDVLRIANLLHVPVMASHSWIRDVAFGNHVVQKGSACTIQPRPDSFFQAAGSYGTSNIEKTAHEAQLTAAELAAIEKLGGMFGIVHDAGSVGIQWAPDIALDRDATTKSFAQAFLYTRAKYGKAIAIGTDLNGFLGAPPPRFEGPDLTAQEKAITTCPRPPTHAPPGPSLGPPTDTIRDDAHVGRVAQDLRTKVVYDFGGKIYDRVEGSLQREPLDGDFVCDGNRGKSWDLNYDGLAHYGMLPDYLQDLHNIGVGEEDLAAFFGSLEAYLRMWEQVEARAAELKQVIP